MMDDSNAATPKPKSSKPLTVRQWPTAVKDEESLKQTINRMNTEIDGGFRHLTEESLEAQIEKLGDAAALDDSDNKDAEDAIEEQTPEQTKGNNEYIAAKGTAMLQYAAHALDESSTILSFLSLLTSRHYPQTARNTILPDMKEVLPDGSLDFDRWENMPPQPEQSHDEDLVYKGWAMKKLTESADTLLSAASRLEQNVATNSRIWHQIVHVRQNGWIVFMNPLNRRHLGVQVASIEAGPTFREQGLISFIPDADGAIQLKAQSLKSIRVSLAVNGKTTSCSKLRFRTPSNPLDQISLHTHLLQARDSLLEQELFSEMMFETRSLLSFGVSSSAQVIRIPISHVKNVDTVLLVELISNEESEQDQDSLDDSSSAFPQAISLALRLMLSHLHTQRLYRRTSRPPPISDSKKTEPTSSIIRPILTHLLHLSSLNSFYEYTLNLKASLEAAKLCLSTQNVPLQAFQPATNQIQIVLSKKVSGNNDHHSTPLEKAKNADMAITLTIRTTLSDLPFTSFFSYSLPPAISSVAGSPFLSDAFLDPISNAIPRNFETDDVYTACHMLGETLSLQICHFYLLSSADMQWRKKQKRVDDGSASSWVALQGYAKVNQCGERPGAMSVKIVGQEADLHLLCGNEKEFEGEKEAEEWIWRKDDRDMEVATGLEEMAMLYVNSLDDR